MLDLRQMEYKGYTAVITFDEQAETLYGEVIGLRDAIMFEGISVNGIRKSFHTAVDDYLEFCKSRGEDPERPYSGKFLVRVQPDLHRKVAATAHKEGKSLNAWVEGTISAAVKIPMSTGIKEIFTKRQASTASKTWAPPNASNQQQPPAEIGELQVEEATAHNG
jgi:predicted HicB family RNase H-like nuclease